MYTLPILCVSACSICAPDRSDSFYTHNNIHLLNVWKVLCDREWAAHRLTLFIWPEKVFFIYTVKCYIFGH